MRKSMKQPILTLAIGATLVLAGCASNPTNQDIGTVLGGVLGGIGGSQIGEGQGRTAAIIVGTLVGAAIGGSIGRTMDDVDRMKVASALENSPTNRSTTWRNPDSGNRYTVTPRRTYRQAEQTYCREYSMEAQIGGRREELYGTACRQPDGRWRMQS